MPFGSLMNCFKKTATDLAEDYGVPKQLVEGDNKDTSILLRPNLFFTNCTLTLFILQVVLMQSLTKMKLKEKEMGVVHEALM